MNRSGEIGVVVAVLAALLVGAVFAISVFNTTQKPAAEVAAAAAPEQAKVTASEQLAQEKAAPVFVHVNLPVAQDDLDGAGTRIPVQVDGTMANGVSYSQLWFVDGAGSGIELEPGTYSMSIPAGYINSEGVVHTAPENTTLKAKVAEDAETGTTMYAKVERTDRAPDNYVSDEIREEVEALAPSAQEILDFPQVAAVDVTDEMIEEIVAVAKKNPQDGGRAEMARKAATDAAKTAQAAARKAAAEAQAEEQRLLAEEQRARALEESARALEEARAQREEAEKKAAEEEKKKKAAEEEENRAKITVDTLDGWWAATTGETTTYHYFHAGACDQYSEGTGAAQAPSAPEGADASAAGDAAAGDAAGDAATADDTATGSAPALLVSTGVDSFARLDEKQREQLGGGGFVVVMDGQTYVMLDNNEALLEARTADLKERSGTSLERTTPPDAVAALVSLQNAS